VSGMVEDERLDVQISSSFFILCTLPPEASPGD